MIYLLNTKEFYFAIILSSMTAYILVAIYFLKKVMFHL